MHITERQMEYLLNPSRCDANNACVLNLKGVNLSDHGGNMLQLLVLDLTPNV